MIQFNKTIFQFTKRLALVVILMSVSIVAFGSHNTKHTSTVGVTSNPSGAGTVYIRTAWDENYNNQVSATQSCINVLFGYVDATDTHTYYMQANSTPTSDALKAQYTFLADTKYKWDQWSDGLSYSSLNLEPAEGYVIEEKEWGNLTQINRTLTATWLLPSFSNEEDIKETILCQNPLAETETKNITVSLKNESYNKSTGHADFFFNWTENISNPSMGTLSSTPADAKYKDAITIPVSYEPTGIHNEQGTIYCIQGASKYIGSNEKPTFKTCSITIIENYMPLFEMQTTAGKETQTNDQISIPLTNLNAAAQAAQEWDFDLSNTTNFVFDGTPSKDNIVVNFINTEEVEENTVYTTILTVKCTYKDKRKDAEGNDAPTPGLECEKQCVITITLTPSGTSILAFTPGDDIVFNAVYPAGDSKTLNIQKAKVSNIEVVWDGNITNDGALTFERNDLSVLVKLNENTVPGEYTKKLKVSAQSTIAGQMVEPDYVNVTATVSLAPIELRAFPGDGCAYLEWDEVPGATGYKIDYTGNGQSKETILSKDVFEVTIDGLANKNKYCFTVTALYAPNTNYNSVSEEVCIEPQNLVTEITKGLSPKTGIFTGTEHTGDSHPLDGTFPYMTKRNIDVSAAFGDEGPLFDKLVIFGLTTNTNNTVKNGYHDLTNIAEAITPCYIYKKEGDKYVLSHKDNGEWMFVPDMNTPDKHEYYDIEGDAVYFTGYCPSASTGNTWDDNGGVINAGSLGKAKTVYLDNLQLYARDHAITIEYTKDSDVSSFFSEGANIFLKGSGAAIAVYGEGNIHISGMNILRGADGRTLRINNKYYKGTFEQESSPIQCYKSDLLKIDDIWKTEARTNGSLSLMNNNATNSLLIDLGIACNLNFEGGQIFFENKENTLIAGGIYQSVNSNQYGNKTIFGAKGQLRGNESSDMADIDYKVSFKDGTYDADMPLTCPLGFTVDGGSYVCDFMYNKDPRAEDFEAKNTDHLPENSQGKILYKVSANITSEVGNIENGLVKFSTTGFGRLMDNIFPKANYKVEVDGRPLYASLKGYYASSNSYGHNSLSAPTGTVYLYLPQDVEAQLSGWAICKPTYTQTMNGETEVKEGNVTEALFSTPAGEPVPAEDLIATTKLLYATIDGITENVLESTGDIEITSYDHHVVNKPDYIITDKVYMLLPVVAGQWKMIVPPFDVHNVYVIESCSEEYLKEKYGTDQRYGGKKIIGADKIAAARNEQAMSTAALLAEWSNQKEGYNEDFFEGTTDSYGSFVTEWINNNKDSQPLIKQVYHYTGDNGVYPTGMKWWDANYYLYKTPTKVWTATSELDGNDELVTFGTDWDYVRVQSKPHGNAVIMQRGEVYTMQFPATVGTTYDDWNYWTGKYILLEGFGPQTIYGADKDVKPAMNLDPYQAIVTGNASFATTTVSSDILFHLKEDEATKVWDFTRTEVEEGATSTTPSHKLRPMEGFLFANVDSEPIISTNEQGQIIQTQKIAKVIKMETGEVMYEVKTEILDDNNSGLGSGVPTIMGDLTLMVVPTPEGLTITPIKEQHVMLFDANGKMIFSKHLSAEENVTLPTGVYVVRGEYEQVKAIKK